MGDKLGPIIKSSIIRLSMTSLVLSMATLRHNATQIYQCTMMNPPQVSFILE